MPPKPKITKEMIIETGFAIAKREGAGKITARSISEQLKCSTQPIYVVFLIVGDNISQNIGISKLLTAPICIMLTIEIFIWIAKNNLQEKYGLCILRADIKRYLYFIPLVLLASVNSMLCVGFIEEIIFRGFLFKAICKDNITQAIIISSVTFGFGHIVNLLNGKDIPETLMQICYAAAIGFLFTI